MFEDLELLRETLAIVGSATALLSTGYLWWVRSNRERPQLEMQLLIPLTGTVLGNGDYETQQRVGRSAGQVVAKYRLKLVVINNSLMPNAILAIRVSLRMADGTYRVMDVSPLDGSDSLFPRNVSPMTTTCLDLGLATAIEGQLGGGFAVHAQMAGDALMAPPSVRVELLGLKQQVFASSWEDDGTGLSRSGKSAAIQVA